MTYTEVYILKKAAYKQLLGQKNIPSVPTVVYGTQGAKTMLGEQLTSMDKMDVANSQVYIGGKGKVKNVWSDIMKKKYKVRNAWDDTVSKFQQNNKVS